ncbi:MAG: hypothetical protein JW726_08380 [Anaerolineales bacterium]|nr:hypothetical protein [Anaerolineales bacterium]
MAGRVALLPLVCLKCETPLPAQADEVAWVCGRCGQGMLLDEEKGLITLQVNYSAEIQPGQRGKPFWVVQGAAATQRRVYGLSNQSTEAEQMWSGGRSFFIPAFNLPLELLAEIGPHMLLHPPSLRPGPAAAFEPITLHPKDLQAVAEYIVLTIEANRKDQLRELNIRLNLSEPALWVLP